MFGDKLQSIKDLIVAAEDSDSDESVQAKFQSKQKEIKIKEMERATRQTAAASGLPYIDLFGFAISSEALSILSEEEAKALKTVCFYYDSQGIRLATINPDNPALFDLIKKLKAKYLNLKAYYISANSLEYALSLYKALPKVRMIEKGVSIKEEELNKYSEKFSSFQNLQDQINSAQITDIVAMILAASIKSRASDIHIEGEEKGIKVRFRIDGVLHDAAELEKVVWQKLISRFKALSGVKINISDKPQDGRISINLKNERIDIRASFLPTAFGESVVMRLLRSSSVGLTFKDLGIKGKAFEQLKREIERPNGMIITTGPTGSGKTTTLYAILKKLNNPETKIITIEDPIEYQLQGVNQSQTSEKYTFAHGLRSIVRQDPDIIMVGEIRDLETAEIGIQAALTGHLVLSTIHTNDAAGTVPRFLSMGVKPFLLAPALNVMIGQRLVRRICPACKKEAAINAEQMERVLKIIDSLPDDVKKNIDKKNMKFYKGEGCDGCQTLGFKGQIGIYEIMTMNDEIEKLILTGNASEYDMRNAAVKSGMITMLQDGFLKALDGVTSVEELFRVAE